jgi:alkylation response protein AidB-like acyl-CoA dehydrogenase
MSTITEQRENTPPLTRLSEEEQMFQASVRRFAREQIGPHVREMDEAGAFRKDVLTKMFEMGLMAIEIPEEYGGQGGSFFQAVLAVEELAAVDPSASVIVDVQNTLVNNAIIRWRTEQLAPTRSRRPVRARTRLRCRPAQCLMVITTF